MGQSPGLRPLTLVERQGAWVFGILPVSAVYVSLHLATYFITQPDQPLWFYITGIPTVEVPLPFSVGEVARVNLIAYLARSIYLVAYFTWGRSTGHLVVGAYIVDRKTMRQIGPGRRLIRGAIQLAGATQLTIIPLYLILDTLSLLLILNDREQRRSVYDWIAGTLVVTGDVPGEPERVSWRQRLGVLGRALRPRPAAAAQG